MLSRTLSVVPSTPDINTDPDIDIDIDPDTNIDTNSTSKPDLRSTMTLKPKEPSTFSEKKYVATDLYA